jgi:gliding motility-associated-like protein
MKRVLKYNILFLAFIVFNSESTAQCSPPSELLFIKTSDSICLGTKQLTLRTSKAKESGTKYKWTRPKGDTITNDTFLIINNPIALRDSGNYFVAASNGTCASNSIGPLKITLLGAPTASDTVKKLQTCGVNEKILNSKFKTSATVKGKWLDTEGVVFTDKNKEETLARNLKIGKNILVWDVSTDFCKSFFRDTFIVTVEAIPRLNAETLTLDARNNSLSVPLGSISGSNINQIEDVILKILPQTAQATNGTVSQDGRKLKYERKGNFKGTDNFTIRVCNKRCMDLCSAPINFSIDVEYEEQYPNVTVPKVFNPIQSQGFIIENIKRYPVNELHILDRWGTRLELLENGKIWDGTHNGKILATGAYYYFFYAKQDSGMPPKQNLKPIAGIFYIVN